MNQIKKTNVVIDFFLQMAKYKMTNSREDMHMSYNTLNAARNGSHPLKADHITYIAEGLFSGEYELNFRQLPTEIRRHLTREEFYARLFAALLDDDSELIGRVANMLQGLADGRLPTTGELAAHLSQLQQKRR